MYVCITQVEMHYSEVGLLIFNKNNSFKNVYSRSVRAGVAGSVVGAPKIQ